MTVLGIILRTERKSSACDSLGPKSIVPVKREFLSPDPNGITFREKHKEQSIK